jgi:hypothetical protein
MTRNCSLPVPWLFASPQTLTPRVVMGDTADIAKALAGESVYTVNSVSMALVLHHLRVNAQLANITLPQRLTVEERESGYENWLAEIRAYQHAAGARLEAARKRLLKA